MKINCYGSCRVFEPLELLSQYQLVDIYSYKAKWYTHSPFETLQKHEMLSEAKSFNFSDFKYLIADVNRAKDLYVQLGSLIEYRDYVLNSSITIIEISSLKALVNNAVDLKYQHLGLYNEFKRNAVKGYDKFESSFVQSNEKEFYTCLNTLIDKVGPSKCLIVGYIETGAPARELINKLLNEICEEKGCFFFNPTSLLAQYDKDSIMINDTHYQPSFFNIIASKLCEYIFFKDKAKANFYSLFLSIYIIVHWTNLHHVMNLLSYL